MKHETTFIYTLSCPKTGLVRYVGKSNNPSKRYNRHTETCNDETSHKVSWIKGLLIEGYKPTLNIIDEVPFCDWKEMEKQYIKMFKSAGANLVNTTSGGDGGLSFEARIKLSEINKGKDYLSSEQRAAANKKLSDYVNNNPPWNKGKRYSLSLSEEKKENRSKAQKGKHGGKPVLQYSADGVFIKEWDSAYDIQKNTGISFKLISACCTERVKTSKGYKWKFK